jgi:hypothetical protein
VFHLKHDIAAVLLAAALQVVLDGELLGTTPVTARVIPSSLRVLVPPPVAPAAKADAELVQKIAEQEKVDEAVAELVVEKPGAETAAKVIDDPAQVEDMPVVAPSTK